jgi:hypothetical protein
MDTKLFFDSSTFDNDVQYLRMSEAQRKDFLQQTFGVKASDAIVSDEAVMAMYTAAGTPGLERIMVANTIKAPAGFTLDVGGKILWANMGYNEADEWRQRIWTLSCELSNPAAYHRPPHIKIIPAVFPAEA